MRAGCGALTASAAPVIPAAGGEVVPDEEQEEFGESDDDMGFSLFK